MNSDIRVIQQWAGDSWQLYCGDSAEVLCGLPSQSIGLTCSSIPFSSLFCYSASPRDLGNCSDDSEFFGHLGHITRELLRVTMPGRLACVHVMNLVTTKSMHGVIGLRDFRGDTIRHFTGHDWIFHGEVAIDKDPQAAAIRTKAKGLLFAQLNRDSSWMRPALADYLLLFRAPGVNPVAVKPDCDNEDWILWARPVWYNIRETEVLNVAVARENKDERHVCPLQLQTIERAVRLWSNRGDVVLDPFNGIGSSGVVALKHGRRYVGIELKATYAAVAARNLCDAERMASTPTLPFEETQ